MRAARRRGGDPARGDCHRGSQPARARAADLRYLRDAWHRRRGRRDGRRGRRALNRAVLHAACSSGRPFVTLKAALSLDGLVAAAPRRADGADRAGRRIALVHRQRAEVDAIGDRIRDVLVDDPLLTARGAYRDRPLVRVVFDRRLRTPPSARVLSTLDAGPVIIVESTRVSSAAMARAEALAAPAPSSSASRTPATSSGVGVVPARRAARSRQRATSCRSSSKAGPRCTTRSGAPGSSIACSLHHAGDARRRRRRVDCAAHGGIACSAI